MERASSIFYLEAIAPMDTSLMAGFEMIAVVTLMTMVVCPMLLWILPNRRSPAN